MCSQLPPPKAQRPAKSLRCARSTARARNATASSRVGSRSDAWVWQAPSRKGMRITTANRLGRRRGRGFITLGAARSRSGSPPVHIPIDIPLWPTALRHLDTDHECRLPVTVDPPEAVLEPVVPEIASGGALGDVPFLALCMSSREPETERSVGQPVDDKITVRSLTGPVN